MTSKPQPYKLIKDVEYVTNQGLYNQWDFDYIQQEPNYISEIIIIIFW